MNVRKRLFGLSLGFLALCSMLALQARGDDMDRASKLTFNQPIEIPGKVLPTGTYWFVVESTDGGGIVRIFNDTRTRLLVSIKTVAADRQELTENAEFVVAEPSGKNSVALLRWFYPTEFSGHEFVYDRKEEAVLAHEPQLTVMVAPAPSVSGD